MADRLVLILLPISRLLEQRPRRLNRLQAEILVRLQPLFPVRIPVQTLSVEEEGIDGTWQVVATIELG